MQHCPARLARGCQRARLHLDRCDAGMGMGAGARRWNWLVTHNRAAFSTCAAGCGAPTENCWRCRPHSRDALRHTRPMEASLRPRGQSGERSAAACGSPSKSRRSRPCGHGKLGLQHAVAAPATEPPAATSNQGPSAKTATQQDSAAACLGSGSIRYRYRYQTRREVHPLVGTGICTVTEKQAHPPTSAHAHPTYRFTRSGGSEVTRLTAVGARVSFEVVYV